MTAGSVSSDPSSRTTLPEMKAIDAEDSGATAGTGRGCVVEFSEPLEPEEVLPPPPERPCATADALTAKMRKARRRSGDIMAGPQKVLNPEYMPFGGRASIYVGLRQR